MTLDHSLLTWVRPLCSDAGYAPSTFPPPDPKPPGTGRNARGRPVMVEVAARPFALVMADGRGRVGMGGDLRGAALAACKTARR
jgi:hypothetical protein